MKYESLRIRQLPDFFAGNHGYKIARMRQNSIHLPTSIINKKATLLVDTITLKSSSLHRGLVKQQMNCTGSGSNWQETN